MSNDLRQKAALPGVNCNNEPYTVTGTEGVERRLSLSFSTHIQPMECAVALMTVTELWKPVTSTPAPEIAQRQSHLVTDGDRVNATAKGTRARAHTHTHTHRESMRESRDHSQLTVRRLWR